MKPGGIITKNEQIDLNKDTKVTKIKFLILEIDLYKWEPLSLF
jgi:hypothetical protein